MDNEPVYVTFEFNGNLGEEIDKVILSLKGMQDESAETFKRLLQDSDTAFTSMTKEGQALAVSIQQDIVSLRHLAAARNSLDAEFEKGAVSVEAYAQSKARLAVLEGELQTKIKTQTAALSQQSLALRQTASAAAAPIAGFNSLSFSVQQVARELPTLTMGAHMFFLALSNNIPILADNIQKARAEYAALVALGQKATPVWKQMLSSIVSWQTALVVGVTLLVAYGREITEWLGGLFRAKKAIDDLKISQKEFEKIEKDASLTLGSQITTIKTLQERWKSLGGELNKQERFIKETKGDFDKLGVSVNSVAEAENVLIGNTPALVSALKARAIAASAAKLADGKYAEAIQKEIESERKLAESETESAKQIGGSRYKVVGGIQVQEWLPKSYYLKKEAELALEESKRLAAEADKFFDYSFEKSQKAREFLSNAGINEASGTGSGGGGGGGGSSGDRDARRAAERHAELLREIEEMRDKIRRNVLDGELELREEQNRLMEEGLEKTLAEIDLAYDRRIAEVAKKGEELIKAHNEIERKIFEAENPEWQKEGLVPPAGITSVSQLTETERRRLEDLQFLAREQRLKDIAEAESNAAGEIEKIWAEINEAFLSDLDNRLNEIDRFYKEKIKKARASGASEVEISAMIALRVKEKDEARNEAFIESSMQRVEMEEEHEQRLLEAKGKYDFLYHLKRNSLEKKYALERLNILKKAIAQEGSEREKEIEREKKRLENMIVWLDENAETLAVDKIQEVLDGFSDIAGAIGNVGGEMEEVGKALERFVDIAKNLASKNYLGAAVSLLEGFFQMLGEYKEGVLSDLIKSESDYWNAINYNIERHVELMKELAGVSYQQARSLIQRQIDELTDRIGSIPFDINSEVFKDFERRVKIRLETETDPFTRDMLNRYLKPQEHENGWFILGEYDHYAFDMLADLTAEEMVALKGIAEIWSILPDGIKDYIDRLEEALDREKELKEYADELYTATTYNAVADAIIEGFKAGKRPAEEFADDFEQMLKEAVLRSIRTGILDKSAKEWYEAFSSYASDGLTGDEIAELRRSYNEMIERANKELENMEAATGLSFAVEASREASRKGLESISQDSADALNGRFTTMLYYQDKIHVAVVDMRTLIASVLDLTGEIAVNTSYCRRLDAIDRNMEKTSRNMEIIVRDGLLMRK